MVKKVKISIGDFALPVPRRGSIEAHSGFGRASALGQEIHQRVQANRAKDHASYQAEVPISCEFERGGFIFEVSGRVDGFFGEKDPRIEEIKSSFSLKELSKRLRETPDHPYCLQLKTYGYFHFLKTKQVPQLSFHLVSTRNWETEDMALRLDIEEYEKWLDLRLDELVEEAILAEKRAKRRRKAGEALVFPFTQPRAGQIDLIRTVEEGMREDKRMLIQAPTGLGKTVGVLFPVLQEALGRGQRIIYVTPKNSQHSVAEEAVAKLQEQGAKIKAMTLTAKSKICFKNEPLCNPEYCEYAKGHYTKVAEHKVLEELGKKRKLSSKTFRELGEKYEVCPFELQLDSAKEMDAVICDYNYVFAPRSAFGRLAASGFDQEGKPNLVIDEAHNLPARAMGYHSPELSVQALRRIADDLDAIPKKFQIEVRELIDLSVAAIRQCEPDDCKSTVKIDPPAEVFLEQDALLRAFLSRYLESDVDIQPRDPVLRLCFYWSEFTAALEFVEEGKREEFFTTYNPQGAVKITCCDASEMLKDAYNEYEQVVGFSATLKPFDFYSQLSGLEGTDLKTAEFQSPFPKSQRKLLIIPQISSKYSERTRNYPRIAETISKISSLKPGNYLAFFPSFDFLDKVLAQFQIPEGFSIRRQERYMKQTDTEALLDDLRSETKPTIVFAVQGGVFSEGVDYPGKMVIGAFVVGPPLPNFDLEREEMRAYYEKNYKAGFDYAYTYPAMAKAVQSAGRVIRSETDKGIVVLMDNRFLQPSYTKSMPRDWFDTDAKELVSTGILKEVSDFWLEPSPG
ncbi:MAG: ATP-dependent DNA helicase [Bacteriovoracia bacterium]